ncbi:hypothetical protein V6N13_100562 [Hibiscus sabdariffa]|uniref:Uncharacterized protein n=1 Tax=Hibiscus sabdariffa TaxID=183260 RepID=A0ABR2BC74_9ROSI
MKTETGRKSCEKLTLSSLISSKSATDLFHELLNFLMRQGSRSDRQLQRLCQGISDVVIRMNFTYLHISSVYDLSYEVEVPKNVFGYLMRSGFLCLRNGSIVITIEL